MSDTVFANGLKVSPPSSKAPEYVKLKLGFEADKFIKFLREHVNERGWVNVEVKEGRSGNLYAALDTFKTVDEPKSTKTISEDMGDDEIPF